MCHRGERTAITTAVNTTNNTTRINTYFRRSTCCSVFFMLFVAVVFGVCDGTYGNKTLRYLK